MKFLYSLQTSFILFASLMITFLYVPTVRAGMYYDVEIKGAYEDNVVGLLSDKRTGAMGGSGMTAAGGPVMGAGMMPGGPGSSGQSNSDTSATLSAGLGGSTELTSDTSLFLGGSALHTSYSSFTQFNTTTGGLSAGVIQGLGDIVIARLALNYELRRYGDSERDSAAYGASVLFKEKFTPSFWLKESYGYEKNKADTALFTYTGNAAGIRAGILPLPLPQTTILLGYNYLVRDYDEPAGFTVTAHTISLGVEQALAKQWFLDAQYDRQASDSNLPGTNTTDNMVSVGLRYSY